MVTGAIPEDSDLFWQILKNLGQENPEREVWGK
jgi:hypothetical protein